MFDFCTLTVIHVCLNVANSGHFMFSGDLAKLAITYAHVDRFYCNLVLCLQLDVVNQSCELAQVVYVFSGHTV